MAADAEVHGEFHDLQLVAVGVPALFPGGLGEGGEHLLGRGGVAALDDEGGVGDGEIQHDRVPSET